MQWVTESPDITVLVCDVMDSLATEKSPHMGVYTLQMMFGNAAYQISNPNKRSDLLGTQLAGVRSALKAYQSIRTNDPASKVLHFDELLAKEKEGALGEYMAPIVAQKCSESGGA